MSTEKSEILSVGIDIGTTTTSMIVSRLGIANTAASYMVPDISITARKIVYRSEVYRTPLDNRSRLDGDRIREIIRAEYGRAGITPSDVDTGAVIITGESARKENARVILESLSSFAGDFVVSTAGPDLESIIAGRGAGTEDFSSRYSCTAANLDIGGGTANIAVFSCGRLLGQTCLDVGGRLLEYDSEHRITYMSTSFAVLARETGIKLQIGQILTQEQLLAAAQAVAAAIFDALRPESGHLARTMLTASSHPLAVSEPIRYVSFSGGVADCYYRCEQDLFRYGDLGPAIAHCLHEQTAGFEVIRPRGTSRATGVGAGTYMTEVSGSTISYSEDIFPIRNLHVFALSGQAEQAMYQGDAQQAVRELNWFLDQSAADNAGIGLQGKKQLGYHELCCLAQAVLEMDGSVFAPSKPLIIICENDMAKALGQVIRRKIRRDKCVICLDRIRVRSGDYVDIGKTVMDGAAVPVVVKTLIFGA